MYNLIVCPDWLLWSLFDWSVNMQMRIQLRSSDWMGLVSAYWMKQIPESPL